MKTQQNNANKLTDKAFSRLMMTSVLGILLCITCLCSATWAWFNADVSADQNTLQSGRFGLEVSILDPSSASVAVVSRSNGSSVCTLGDAGLYTVTLKMTEDTTVSKGFCAIETDGERYRTASILVGETNPFTFTFEAKKANMTLIFAPAWGIPAEFDVEAGQTLSPSPSAGK